MKLKMGTHQNLAVIAYNARDKYLPYFGELFGNTYQFISLPGYIPGFLQRLVLTRTHWKSKNQPLLKCDETDESSGKLEACIDRYLEGKVGCSSVLQTTERRKPLCRSNEDYSRWAEFAQKIVMAISENEVYDLTGCISPCEKYEYTLSADHDLRHYPYNNATDTHRFVWLEVYFRNGRYPVKEQYYIYDENSLVADIGGYLGLLLGHSLYSIFCGLENLGHILSLSKYRIYREKSRLSSS